MKSLYRLLSAFAAVLILAANLAAQLDTGTITISVKDATGSIVPGANVVLRNEATGIEIRSGVTNEQGNFNAVLIPSGSYLAHVEMKGFKSYQQSAIYLQVNQQISVHVALQVGELTEQVTVTSAAPLVESTSGVIRETIDRVRVSELPLNGRNVLQLQVLVPGSVSSGSLDQGAGTPGYAINGGIGGSNICIHSMEANTRMPTLMPRSHSPTPTPFRNSPYKPAPTARSSAATGEPP